KAKPNALDRFKRIVPREEYLKWVEEVVSFEAREALNNKTLDTTEINRMATEFQVAPEVMIQGVITGNSGLRYESLRLYNEPTTPKNRQSMNTIQRDLLQRYLDGRFVPANPPRRRRRR